MATSWTERRSNRFPRLQSILMTQTGSSPPCSVIPMGRTRSVAFSAPSMAARRGRKCSQKTPSTGGSDVVIDPAQPNVVYAALWESRLGPWEDGNS